MGFFKQMREYRSNPEVERQYYAERIGPHLAPGEPLMSAVTGNNQVRKARGLFAIGVTPDRLLLVPLDRRGNATTPVRSVTREQITSSAIWGWGGSVRDLLSAQSDQEIRFRTATDQGGGEEEWRFLVLGGNWFENRLASETSVDSLGALIEFLQSAKR